ncbi:PAS domain S-box protein [Candidatus Bipolaricaulota bacterium]|nr:PAS domain S-box protein [Candidatus Bipolaricaulota bacterium]
MVGEEWIRNFVSRKNRKEVRGVHEKLLDGGGQEYRHESSVVTTRDEEVIVSWHKGILKAENGEEVGLIGVGQIAESPSGSLPFEEINRTTNSHFEIMDEIKEIVFVHDYEGNFLAVNEEATDHLGYSRKELLSLSHRDIDASGNKSNPGERIEQALEQGESTFESTLSSKEGKPIPVEITLKKISYEGKDVLLGIARNISQRKAKDFRPDRLKSPRESTRTINKLIVKKEDLEELASSASQALSDTRGYMDTVIAFKDLEGKLIFPPGGETDESRETWEIHPKGKEGNGNNIPSCVKEAASEREQVVVKSTEKDCKNCSFSNHDEDHSAVITPMTYQEELVGILSAHLEPQMPLDDQELDLLEEVADNLALGRAQIESNRRLSRREDELNAIYENAPLIMLLVDRERRVRKANGYVGKFVGSPVEDLLGNRGGEVLRCIHHLDDPRGCGFGPHCEDCRIRKTIMDTFETGKSHYQLEANLPILENEGKKEFTFLVSTTLLQHRQNPLVLVSLEDITERKRAEEKLRENEKKYRAVFENTGAATLMIEGDRTISWINEQFEELSGYEAKEVEGKMELSDFVSDRDVKRMSQYHESSRQAGKTPPEQYEFKFLDRKDSVKDVLCNIDVIEGTDKSVASLLDISEKKQAQRELKKREREISVLLGNLPGMAYRCESGRSRTIQFVSEGCMELTGYRPEELVENEEISYGELILPEDREGVRKTVQKGLEKNRQFTMEYRIDTKSGIIKWVWEQGRGVFNENGELENIQGFITSTSERKEVQQKLEHKEEKLRKSFVQLAETTSRVLGVRDPYTQQHEQKVAQISREVGDRLGMDEEEKLGLYLGGVLHDIGKIAIPETILTKPGELKETEWEMIKSHPEVGYDQILKDTDFPWPVAEMTLHHHERLDGSGYPDGLEGDELTREVRVLGAVDVVEAMSTRRPYRGARRKEEVLEEIKSGSGTKYDTEIVDILINMIDEGEVEFGEN